MSLVDRLRGTRYEARTLELLSDTECTVTDNELGVLIYAPIGGAEGVIKVHVLFGDARLLETLPTNRIVIAEVPDDAPFAEMTTTLLSNGFREEGRVNDFVADGIAMRFLVRRSG